MACYSENLGGFVMATAVAVFSKTIVGTDADRAATTEQVVGTSSTSRVDDVWWALISVAVVIVGALIADSVAPDDAFPPTSLPTPAEGLTIFATFYVVAQAVERLLEPFSRVLLPADSEEEEAAKKAVAAQNAVNASTDAQDQVDAAAKAKAELASKGQHRTILFWALASLVGVAVSAGMKLYFLQRVGIANSSRWWEILATGLIIGAGTKPLHDLIEFISAKKSEASKGADQVSPT
jgi:hypothetical protein